MPLLDAVRTKKKGRRQKRGWSLVFPRNLLRTERGERTKCTDGVLIPNMYEPLQDNRMVCNPLERNQICKSQAEPL